MIPLRVEVPRIATVRFDRRALLLGGVALVGAVAVSGRVGFPTGSTSGGRLSVGELSASHFIDHIGSSFAVRAAGIGATSLLLTGVRSRQASPLEPTLLEGEAFSLSFEGPSGRLIPSGRHRLVHPDLDLPALDMSPVGNDTSVQHYQIIVDRRIFDSGVIPKKAG